MKSEIPSLDICDFHAHILPGVDHGSTSYDVSLGQLSLAQKSGYKRIIATSHFYPDREDVSAFVARRDRAYYSLIERNKSSVEIRRGAEVLICDGFERIPMLESLCFPGSNVMLIELPFCELSSNHFYSIKALIEKEIKVVIAHADRYAEADIDRLISIGCMVQLNASSLSGLFVAKHLMRWLDENCVAGIGSDIHSEDNKAYKRFNKALRRIKPYLPYIVEESNKIWNSIEK